MVAWIVDNLPSLLISCFLAWLAWVGKCARDLADYKEVMAAELQHLARRRAADETRTIHEYLRLAKPVPREPWGWWRRRRRSRELGRRVQHFSLTLMFRKPDDTFDVVLAWTAAASRLEAVNRTVGRYGYVTLSLEDLKYTVPGGGPAVFALDAGSYLVVTPTKRQRRRDRSTNTA